MTDLLRWDVLKFCLRHGRFAIDSPTLGITTKKSSHCEQGSAAGIRALLVLHPSIVESCNTNFSSCLDKVKRVRPDDDRWVQSGATGYKRGSGADFSWPPHLKKMAWTSKNSSKICSKLTFFNKVDHLVSDQKQTFRFSPSAGSIIDPILTFLALGDVYQPVHRRMIANLGSSESRWEYGSIDEKGNLRPDLLESAKSVQTHLVHRKMTSAGKMIVTSKVEILDEMHRPQLSYV